MLAKIVSSKNCGFTLIELLVTIGILSIISAIALPSLKPVIDGNRVKGAVNVLYSDLQFARSEATKRNLPVIFSFVSGGSWCYGIHQGSAPCDCSTANSCNIKSVQATEYPGVKLTNTFTGGNTTFTPLLGKVSEQGKVSFSPGSGTTRCINVSKLGQLSTC